MREVWAEEDKNHQAKQCCISITPSRLGEGAQEETAPARVQPEPEPGLLASTPVLLLLHLAMSLRTRRCGKRGSVVPGRGVSQQPEGSGGDRPDPPLWLCCVTEPGWQEVSAKRAFASVFVFFQLDRPTHLCNMCCYHISLILPVRKPGSER